MVEEQTFTIDNEHGSKFPRILFETKGTLNFFFEVLDNGGTLTLSSWFEGKGVLHNVGFDVHSNYPNHAIFHEDYLWKQQIAKEKHEKEKYGSKPKIAVIC